MKRIIYIVLAAFVLTLVPAAQACAQTIDNLRPPTKPVRPKPTPPKPVKKKWKEQGEFSEGLAYVKDANGKYGFIDKTGKVVIPCQWKFAWDFSEGIALVANGKRLGFIDKTGKVVIPCQWKSVGESGVFHEGLLNVADANDKWGYIDKTGKVVILCQWKFAGPFSEGAHASVQDDNDKWYIIDKTGKILESL